MDLSDLVKPQGVLSGVKAGSKKQLLQVLSEKAAELTGLPERDIFETVMQRERLGSTGTGNVCAAGKAGRF
jgi:nitrogen PTS system EIIA component